MNRIDVDKLMRVDAQLLSLRENLPQDATVGGAYIYEYHRNLEVLRNEGLNVEEFKIPTQLILVLPTPKDPKSGEERPPRQLVSRDFFMFKLNAILKYIDMYCETNFQRPPQAIGFRPTTS